MKINKFTEAAEGIFSCNDCGAFGPDVMKIQHHLNCTPGESEKWEDHYGDYASIDPGKELAFIKAGNAIFTIRNENTGGRFTFKVQRHEKKAGDAVWFVRVLTNQDNNKDYTFIGTFWKENAYRHSPRSTIGKDAPSTRVIDWFLTKMRFGNLPDYVKVYHEGRCGRCSKRLTVPESLLSGYGPECIKFI